MWSCIELRGGHRTHIDETGIVEHPIEAQELSSARSAQAERGSWSSVVENEVTKAVRKINLTSLATILSSSWC